MSWNDRVAIVVSELTWTSLHEEARKRCVKVERLLNEIIEMALMDERRARKIGP